MGGLALPQIVAGGAAERTAVAQGGDHDLPGRRTAASGHARPEARRPVGSPRRIRPDRHQRAGHPDQRIDAAGGRHDGPLRHHSLAGGGRRPARFVRVLHRASLQQQAAARGWPAMGSALSKLYGPVDPSVPPYIDLSHKMAHDPWNIKGPGFLGIGARAVPSRRRVDAEHDAARDLGRSAGRPLEPAGRTRPLPPRSADRAAGAGVGDSFTEQALGVLTSSKLVEALDLEREDPEVRAPLRAGQSRRAGLLARQGLHGDDVAVPAGAAAGGSRRPLRDLQLRPLRLARPELRQRPQGGAAAGPGRGGAGGGPARARHGART